jgi:hypothetical protein
MRWLRRKRIGRTVIVQLYKALGGGWSLTNQQWADPK